MKSHLTINNQPVPWSFIGKVKRQLNGDMDTVIDLFWKARNHPDVIRYVAKAIVDGHWSHESRERENGQMETVREWWQRLYEPKNGPTPMKKELKKVFEQLAKGL